MNIKQLKRNEKYINCYGAPPGYTDEKARWYVCYHSPKK